MTVKTRMSAGVAAAVLALLGALATPAAAGGNDNHPDPCRDCHWGPGGPPSPSPSPDPDPVPLPWPLPDPEPAPGPEDDGDPRAPEDDDSGDEPETEPADPGGGSGGVVGRW